MGTGVGAILGTIVGTEVAVKTGEGEGEDDINDCVFLFPPNEGASSGTESFPTVTVRFGSFSSTLASVWSPR